MKKSKVSLKNPVIHVKYSSSKIQAKLPFCFFSYAGLAANALQMVLLLYRTWKFFTGHESVCSSDGMRNLKKKIISVKGGHVPTFFTAIQNNFFKLVCVCIFVCVSARACVCKIHGQLINPAFKAFTQLRQCFLPYIFQHRSFSIIFILFIFLLYQQFGYQNFLLL